MLESCPQGYDSDTLVWTWQQTTTQQYFALHRKVTKVWTFGLPGLRASFGMGPRKALAALESHLWRHSCSATWKQGGGTPLMCQTWYPTVIQASGEITAVSPAVRVVSEANIYVGRSVRCNGVGRVGNGILQCLGLVRRLRSLLVLKAFCQTLTFTSIVGSW